MFPSHFFQFYLLCIFFLMSHKHLFWAQRLYQNNIEGSPRFMKKWLNIHLFKIYNCLRKTKDQEHCLIYYMLNFVLVLRNHTETMFCLTSVQMQCLVKVIKQRRFCNTKHCTFFWVRLLLISVICQSLRLVILSKNIRRLKANKLNCNGKKYKSDVFLNWLFHMHILDVQVLRIIRCFTVGFIVKTYRN